MINNKFTIQIECEVDYENNQITATINNNNKNTIVCGKTIAECLREIATTLEINEKFEASTS